MALTAAELADAHAIIDRALDEDLRYGPDVTSAATVPADATTVASMVSRQQGVIAGLDIAVLVLDKVIGAGAYQIRDRAEDGAEVKPGEPTYERGVYAHTILRSVLDPDDGQPFLMGGHG